MRSICNLHRCQRDSPELNSHIIAPVKHCYAPSWYSQWLQCHVSPLSIRDLHSCPERDSQEQHTPTLAFLTHCYAPPWHSQLLQGHLSPRSIHNLLRCSKQDSQDFKTHILAPLKYRAMRCHGTHNSMPCFAAIDTQLASLQAILPRAKYPHSYTSKTVLCAVMALAMASMSCFATIDTRFGSLFEASSSRA
jgi:hypothetical protein